MPGGQWLHQGIAAFLQLCQQGGDICCGGTAVHCRAQGIFQLGSAFLQRCCAYGGGQTAQGVRLAQGQRHVAPRPGLRDGGGGVRLVLHKPVQHVGIQRGAPHGVAQALGHVQPRDRRRQRAVHGGNRQGAGQISPLPVGVAWAWCNPVL